jgi:DNA-binding HxlR family transcriptional regulator
MQENKQCSPVQTTLNVIGGKWKPLILWNLRENKLRFSELNRRIDGITQKMLTQQLRELEHDGLVSRKIYPEIPPKVEYAITPYGKTLQPVLKSMCAWGEKHQERSFATTTNRSLSKNPVQV